MNKNYLLPGETLRKGVDLIADKKSGGLIVLVILINWKKSPAAA